jgi:hypothetical protein
MLHTHYELKEAPLGGQLVSRASLSYAQHHVYITPPEPVTILIRHVSENEKKQAQKEQVQPNRHTPENMYRIEKLGNGLRGKPRKLTIRRSKELFLLSKTSLSYHSTAVQVVLQVDEYRWVHAYYLPRT